MILNGSEVKAFAGISSNSLSSGAIEPFITDAVLGAYLNSLSYELYVAMQADLVDYSAVAAWASGTSYTIGQKCVVDGIVYEALKTTTAKPTPVPSASWKVAKKFTSTCLEELWLKMRRWLCLKAMQSALAFIIVDISDNGASRKIGGQYQPASNRDTEMVAQAINGQLNQAWTIFVHWINNIATCDYSDYKLACYSKQIETFRTQSNYPKFA